MAMLKVSCTGYYSHARIEFDVEASTISNLSDYEIQQQCPVCQARSEREQLKQEFDNFKSDFEHRIVEMEAYFNEMKAIHANLTDATQPDIT